MEARYADKPASAGKYPTIVIEKFPNMTKHLRTLAEQYGKTPYAICRRSMIHYIPTDASEYHFVIKYFKGIEATEPDLKYVVRPLSVCIRGIPSFIPVDAVEDECTKRGYLVDFAKYITDNLCYVKLCGGKDNTGILEMRELFASKVRVELWKSGPVRREEHTETHVPVADSISNATTSAETAPSVPPLLPGFYSAHSSGYQKADRKDTTAQYPNIMVESFPNREKHLDNINSNFGRIVNTKAQWSNGIRFVPVDGPEYRAVIKYLKSIEATEPHLKYNVTPLSVGIQGLPGCMPIEDVESACAERGYMVDYAMHIMDNLCYVRLCGGKDDIKILELRKLCAFKVRVELWSSSFVRWEEHREPFELATSSIRYATTSEGTPPTGPPREPGFYSAQSSEYQEADSEETEPAKYPSIVMESFPNMAKHLKTLGELYGKPPIAACKHGKVHFIPTDGPEYHFVLRYLRSIKAKEPGLKYVVRSLDVCIYGLPFDYFSTEDVKSALTELRYVVDHVKEIPTSSVCSLYYVKLCGRRDNTRILAMPEFLGYPVSVELWRGGPVRKEKKQTVENFTEATSNTASMASALAQQHPIGIADNSAASTSFLTQPMPPLMTGLRALTDQLTGYQAAAPTFPTQPSPLPAQAGPPAGHQAAASPALPAITPEQAAALSEQIAALTLTIIQIFNQPRTANSDRP